MGMTYLNIDPVSVVTGASASSGFGDPADLTDEDAISAEADACNLEVEHAIMIEHATSVLPNGADPDAAPMQADADAGLAQRDEARATADRISTAIGTDVSGVMQPILNGHRARAEEQYARAEWLASNSVGLTQSEMDAFQLECDRAERVAAVVDGWSV